MSDKYLLPKLKGIVEPRTGEAWERREDAYDFLLEHLELEYESTESVFDGGFSSIPHPFEQMLLFNRVFYDIYHAEHKHVLLEWRAILIIMALKRIKNIKLNLTKVDLTGDSANLFLKAVAGFKPEDDIVFFSTTWDFTYVLSLDNEPIAFFTPITLVCPAKMFKKRIASLEWISLEKVNNQYELVLKFDGRGNEYGNIVEWLEKLKANLTAYDQYNPEIIHRSDYLIGEIENIIKEYSKKVTQVSGHLFQEEIYSSINHSLRKEYDFFNVCCDFACKNKNVEFLKDKYLDDIFSEKLLLLVYDASPDATLKKENISKLHQLINSNMLVDEGRLIFVRDSGGEEIPFFVFLPFKESFMRELISAGISVEELFEEYQSVYSENRKSVEVSMTIKGFPYSFHKEYLLKNCEKICSKDMASIYTWPNQILSNKAWHAYYTYISKSNPLLTVDLACTKVIEREYVPHPVNGNSREAFQIFQSDVFPEYIKFTYNGVSGYFPLIPRKIEKMENGAIATIYVDVGYSNTYVTIIKKKADQRPEKISFHKPNSLWIIKKEGESEFVRYNFPPADEVKEIGKIRYFKNALRSFTDCKTIPETYSMEGIMDGQVLFTDDFYLSGLESISSFVQMDYSSMTEESRKRAHVFLEHIIMCAIQTATMAGCDYFKIRFLHKLENNTAKLGELKGLWDDVLNKAIKRIGARKPVLDVPIDGCSEPRALLYRVYQKIAEEEKTYCKNSLMSENNIYIGMDIGWKKTTIMNLKKDENNEIKANYVSLDFGGQNISFVDKEIPFKSYKNILSVLLSEPYEMKKNKDVDRLLNEFAGLYEERRLDTDYYYGLFDVIAMKIENSNFKISPDIYNKKEEFKNYLGLLTYNMALLFFQVGLFIGKNCDKNNEAKKAYIYLSGNGAKFLLWIANVKNIRKITKENCHEFFIVKSEQTIWHIINKGIELGSSGGKRVEEYEIFLDDNPKEALLDGYIFYENSKVETCKNENSAKKLNGNDAVINPGENEHSISEENEHSIPEENEHSISEENELSTLEAERNESQNNAENINNDTQNMERNQSGDVKFQIIPFDMSESITEKKKIEEVINSLTVDLFGIRENTISEGTQQQSFRDISKVLLENCRSRCGEITKMIDGKKDGIRKEIE